MRVVAWTALFLAGFLSLAMDQGLFARPLAPDLDRLPERLGPLRRVEVVPVAPSSLGEFPPERFLYALVSDGAGHTGRLYVAWFERGRRWSGRPHATDVCFAAEGWEEAEAHRLRRSDGRGVWSRRFRRDGREIRVVHWLERPGSAEGGGWPSQLLRRLGGRGLRQDVASIYWEFDADSCPPEADILAASEVLAASLHDLWGG